MGTDEQDYEAPNRIERSVSLFKRGFEITPSLSPDSYGASTSRDAVCRSCLRRFAPSEVRGGRHVCPNCHGDQKAE